MSLERYLLIINVSYKTAKRSDDKVRESLAK